MLKHKINPSIDCNYWLKRMDTQFDKTTNQNLLKVPKVVKPTNKKTLFLNFGDQCNKQPIVPSLPDCKKYFCTIARNIILNQNKLLDHITVKGNRYHFSYLNILIDKEYQEIFIK